MNMRVESINASSVQFMWQNELNMNWVSFRIGNDIMELRSITSVNDNWTINNIYANQEYVFEWQIGDGLLAFSDYADFSFRTLGWKPDLTDYSYRRFWR